MEMKTSFKTLNHQKLKWKLLWSFTVFYCKLLRRDSWGLGNEGLVTQRKTQRNSLTLFFQNDYKCWVRQWVGWEEVECLVTACHNTGRSGGSHHWVEEDRAQLPSRHAGHQSPDSCLLSPASCLLSPLLSRQGLWLNCSCRRQRKRYQNLSNINTLFPFLTKVEKVRPTNININFLTFWLYLSEEMAWKRLVTIWPWLIHSALKIKTFYFFTFKIEIQG